MLNSKNNLFKVLTLHIEKTRIVGLWWGFIQFIDWHNHELVGVAIQLVAITLNSNIEQLMVVLTKNWL